MDTDPCEEMTNMPPSAEEEQLWAQMIVGLGDSVDPLTASEGTMRFCYERDPGDESQDGEENEGDGAEEQDTHLVVGNLPVSSMAAKVKSPSNQKKSLWKCKMPLAEFDDYHLAAFMYSHLLPEASPQAHCHCKVLNQLYENDKLGM